MVVAGMTHAQGVAGAGATTAGTEVTVGTITLPRPGPWNIWGIYFTVAGGTPTTAEENMEFVRVNDLNGDLTPNPTPLTFPTLAQSAIAGDGQIASTNAWQYKPVNYSAAGGAQLRFHSDVATTLTVANRCAYGVFYGSKPSAFDVMSGLPIYQHCQRVEGTADTNAETSLGTITLSEKARLITALAVNVNMATSAEADEISGLFRIQSDDVNLTPNIYPFSHVTSAPLDPAEAILMTEQQIPKFIPVHIPVPQGAQIEFLTDLDQDVGTAAIAEAYVGYV